MSILLTPPTAEPVMFSNLESWIITFPLPSTPLDVDITAEVPIFENVDLVIFKFPPLSVIIEFVYWLLDTLNLMFFKDKLPHSAMLKTLYVLDLVIEALLKPIIVRFLFIRIFEFPWFWLRGPKIQIVFPFPAFETAYSSVKNGLS